MLYAKVVLGIPVEGPFDYLVPGDYSKKIKVGSRVWVNFCNRKMLGYIVRLSTQTDIVKVKPIISLIEEEPLLDKDMLSLTRELASYYCCSWGEAIETALPRDLRRGKKVSCGFNGSGRIRPQENRETLLLHNLEDKEKWDIYLRHIKEAYTNNASSIILLPDINAAIKAKEIISQSLGTETGLIYRSQPKELEWWLKAKRGTLKIVVGTRSAVFAPVQNLGLVILDEEQDSVYKQDQVPHYHAREVAIMRSVLQKTKLILGSVSPSLEALYLARKNKIKYQFIPRRADFPEIKVIDSRAEYRRKERSILSKYLSDAVMAALNSKEKILLFLNRKGFATSCYCHNCQADIKCPRCNINLVYHFQEGILSCHYCNLKMVLPKICPKCNSGYIKLRGAGTERIESELSRAFPQAKIKRLENAKGLILQDSDIFIATSSIIRHAEYRFGLIGVLGIDNSLNRVDLRAGEKTFAILVGLLGLTDKKIAIQTSCPTHKCFQALLKRDLSIFYDEELKQRKQLKFPPYRHMGLVKLRGKKEEKVKEAAQTIFERLNESKKKGIGVISLGRGEHPKLRGNFYWHILLSSQDPKRLSKFIKNVLKDSRHSGIIVTVDIDPA